MLKKTLLFLLSLTLILMLPSCDLMKGNKFIELGLIDYQSPEVDALIKDIDEGFEPSMPSDGFWNSSSQTGETVKVDITKLDGFSGLFGFTEANLEVNKEVAESISKKGMLKPSENPEELRSMVNKAVDGTANKDLLNKALGQLSNQSVQAHNSVALIASALGEVTDAINKSLIKAGLPEDLTKAIKTMIEDLNKKAEAPKNELTKAEVLQVQLITNFVVSVSNVTNPDESEGEGGDLTIDSPEIQSLVNEAIVLSKYTESIKGIDMIRVPSSDLLSDYITDNGGSGENGGEENVEA